MPTRLAVILLAALAFIVSVWGYGRYQYSKGHTAARVQAEARALALEQGMQYEKDRADAEYRGAIAARQVAEITLSDQRDRINGLLDQLRRAKAADTSGRPNAAGADGIGILIECIDQYEQVGRDAARLADKVGGLQGYVRAIRK